MAVKGECVLVFPRRFAAWRSRRSHWLTLLLCALLNAAAESAISLRMNLLFVRLSGKLSHSFNIVAFLSEGGGDSAAAASGLVTPVAPQWRFLSRCACAAACGRVGGPRSPPCPSPAPPNPRSCRVLCRGRTCMRLLCVVVLRATFLRDRPISGGGEGGEAGLSGVVFFWFFGASRENGGVCRPSAAQADATWTQVWLTEARGQRLLCRARPSLHPAPLRCFTILQESQLGTLWAGPDLILTHGITYSWDFSDLFCV